MKQSYSHLTAGAGGLVVVRSKIRSVERYIYVFAVRTSGANSRRLRARKRVRELLSERDRRLLLRRIRRTRWKFVLLLRIDRRIRANSQRTLRASRSMITGTLPAHLFSGTRVKNRRYLATAPRRLLLLRPPRYTHAPARQSTTTTSSKKIDENG